MITKVVAENVVEQRIDIETKRLLPPNKILENLSFIETKRLLPPNKKNPNN